MMMEKQHKIAEAVFNIAFATHGQMLERSDMLAGLIRNRLAPRMNYVFDACNTDPEVVRIDRLEIDLGHVAYDDLEAVLADRLGQALQDAMHPRSGRINAAATGAGQKVSTRQHDLDLIAHYLSTGRLPWWAERKSQADVTRTLSTLLDRAHRDLIAYLRQQIDPQNPVLSRLVRQFEPDLIRRCFERIAPLAVQAIDHGMSILYSLHTARAVLPLPGHELTWRLSEMLLRRLLATTEAFDATDILVPAALKAVAASLQINPDRLLQNLKASWESLRAKEKRTKFKGLFSDFLTYLEMDRNDRTAPEARTAPEQPVTRRFPSDRPEKKLLARTEHVNGAQNTVQPTDDVIRTLSSQLSKALTHPGLDGLSDVWPQILKASPETTRALIVKHARQDDVRRALARHLTSRQFFDLLKLMETKYVEFIATLGDHLAHMQSADSIASPFPAHATVRFREVTLTYLMEERMQRFRPKHYFASTIHRLAADIGTTCEALLFRLRETFDSVPGIDATNLRQLLSQVDALQALAGRSQSRPPQDPNDPAPQNVEALPATLRNTLQFAPLADKPVNASMAPHTKGLEPIAPVMEQLSRLLVGLSPEHLAALRSFLESLPAARLRVLADWCFQAANGPEAISLKMAYEATTPQELDHCIAAIMQWLTEKKESGGVAPIVFSERPEHLKGSTGTTAPRLDDRIEPQPARFISSASPDSTTGPIETTHVPNAGMVLAAPFLPRLFDRLHLLDEKQFKNRNAVERAVHLLEYMVTERNVTPEFLLVLNKILCGLDDPKPIARTIDLIQEEVEVVQGLLESLIGHWKIIGNTSVAGLRSSFLQRPGYMSLKDDAWHLQVESRSFDMLLDQLPWSIAVIKHPWMKRVLHVSWR